MLCQIKFLFSVELKKRLYTLSSSVALIETALETLMYHSGAGEMVV
jgi:hypothetical protein